MENSAFDSWSRYFIHFQQFDTYSTVADWAKNCGNLVSNEFILYDMSSSKLYNNSMDDRLWSSSGGVPNSSYHNLAYAFKRKK